MKKLIFTGIALITSVSFAAKPSMLSCVDELHTLEANLETKMFYSYETGSTKPIWGDRIINVAFKPGFESLPPITKVSVTLKNGTFNVNIIDQKKSDQDGVYKLARYGVLNHHMTGNEDHRFSHCVLTYSE